MEELPSFGDWMGRVIRLPESVESTDDRMPDGEATIQPKEGDAQHWVFHTLDVGDTPEGHRLLMTAAIDVTERRIQEERIHAMNLRLHETNRGLERMNLELQQFAYIASHDLQEPLRKIQAFTDIVIDDHGQDLDEEARDFLRRAQSSAKRMSELISSLLDLSRVSRAELHGAAVDLERVAREAVADLEVRIGETNATVEIGELPTVEGDDVQLRRLFQNLIDNGMKFRRDDIAPRIRIEGETLETDDGVPEELRSRLPLVRMRVCDNGIGIDTKYRDRIFLPFQQLHRRNEFEGMGMGLAFSKRIVERHRGSISVENAPDGGATFIIYLPIKPDAPVQFQLQREDSL